MIGTIRCQKVYKIYFQRIRTGPNPEDEKIITPEYPYEFCFEDDLPIRPGEEGDWYEYLREGDILNIRTNIDLEYPPTRDHPRWDDQNAYIGNIFHCAFLIELDHFKYFFLEYKNYAS